MNSINFVTALEYSRYQQWEKLRQARHERLVNQVLLHTKDRQRRFKPGHLAKQADKALLAGRILSDRPVDK